MDRASLREGSLRLWVPAIADASETETLHEEDLPGCCRRSAGSGTQEPFDCAGCGASWQVPQAVEPEVCAFMERGNAGRQGAA